MAITFFKTTDDLKNHLPSFQGSSELDSFQPHIDHAADEYLIPYISRGLYDTLITQYNSDSLTTANDAIFTYLQKALAHYAMYVAIPFINAKLANTGMHAQRSNDGFQQLPQWRNNETKGAAIKTADLYLDKALEVMEANPDNYTDWRDSNGYTLRTQFFINSAKEYSDILNIGESRRTFLALSHWIKETENRYLKDAIGSELFNAIKSAIEADDLTEAEGIILPMIKQFVVYQSMYKAAPHLKIDVSIKGIRISSENDGITSFMPNDLAYKEWRNEIKAMADSYIGELKKYLEEYYEDFPEYESSTAKGNGTPQTGFRDNSGSNSSVFV